jgi:hypothetical protein
VAVGTIHRQRSRRIGKDLEKRPALDQSEEQGADPGHDQDQDAQGPEIRVMDQTLDDVVYKLQQEQH